MHFIWYLVFFSVAITLLLLYIFWQNNNYIKQSTQDKKNLIEQLKTDQKIYTNLSKKDTLQFSVEASLSIDDIQKSYNELLQKYEELKKTDNREELEKEDDQIEKDIVTQNNINKDLQSKLDEIKRKVNNLVGGSTGLLTNKFSSYSIANELYKSIDKKYYTLF